MKDSVVDLYDNAHLFVSAIRVLTHQNYEPPSLEQICQALMFSIELGTKILRKLEELGIVEEVIGGYGGRLFIRNHVRIEEIPKDVKGLSLDQEIERFRNTKRNVSTEIKTFQARQQERKKMLFAELEKQLKDGMKKGDPENTPGSV